MRNFLLLSLLAIFNLPLIAQSGDVTPENHPMLGEYYATYENRDGSKMNYVVQITPADDNFPNSLYINNLMPRYQEFGSIVYAYPASIVSENSVKLELWYPIEGNVDLSSISELEGECDLFLFAANVIGDEISLNTNVNDVSMVLSEDGKSITIDPIQKANALVVAPIVEGVPRGPFVRCMKLPMVMTTEEPEEPTGLNNNVKSMYSVYPTVTDGELNISGFGGTAFVYDVNGNMVQALDCSNNTRFDLSALNSGNYILKLNTATVKIIIE